LEPTTCEPLVETVLPIVTGPPTDKLPPNIPSPVAINLEPEEITSDEIESLLPRRTKSFTDNWDAHIAVPRVDDDDENWMAPIAVRPLLPMHAEPRTVTSLPKTVNSPIDTVLDITVDPVILCDDP
jgi:hypothetical protein